MIYVVQPGDNLLKICRALYDDGLEYHDLAAYNSIKNPNLIHVGQVLKLHKTPNVLTHLQKVVNTEPSKEKLYEICDLFCEGFCTMEMARDIYKTVIK